MVRFPVVLVGASLAVGAIAQTPDLAIKADLYPNVASKNNSTTRFRWIDSMGRYSTVGLGLTLEPGYYVFIAERLQHLTRDVDTDFLDQAYIEDPGSWRIGKQYLPFGERNLMRESVLAGRTDIDLFRRGIPVQVVAFDAGRSRQRGGMVRINSRVGLSFAVGQHLGATGTSIAAIRDPEDASGPDRGYRVALGADAGKSFGNLRIVGEGLLLRRGNTPSDPKRDITDFRAIITALQGRQTFTVGWTREWRNKRDFYRLESELKMGKNVYVTGFVRFRRGVAQDLSIGLRVKM